MERAHALSVFTGMPPFWAYTILLNDAPQTGPSPTDADDQYIQTYWAGNRAAFEEALNDCSRRLDANPDDQATISEVLKRIRGPGSRVTPKPADSGEASSGSEPSTSDLDLPAAA